MVGFLDAADPSQALAFAREPAGDIERADVGIVRLVPGEQWGSAAPDDRPRVGEARQDRSELEQDALRRHDGRGVVAGIYRGSQLASLAHEGGQQRVAITEPARPAPGTRRTPSSVRPRAW